jgi:glycosyltransferase involved in cell wall biosynthesis
VVKVSIVIKALNEESNISRAIESALAAVAPYGGEVIIADSASTDGTIGIAKQFPTSIVQLRHAGERCCGIGPQLGYQHSIGEYVYILDGDMELQADFLSKAVAILDSEPDVAGVGGYIHETRVDNLEVKARVKRHGRARAKNLLDVECLNGGGLYRRAAIAAIGYLSDRNLYAFEEYDLGARLRSNSWRLVRLEDKAVDHFSYEMGTWPLLWHRLRSGRFLSSGQLFRAAVEGHYARRVLREVRTVPIDLGVWLYWACLLVASYELGARIIIPLGVAAPLLLMAVRTRSLKLALFSVLTWHISAIGFVLGFLKRRKQPAALVESTIIQQAAAHPSVEIVN